MNVQHGLIDRMKSESFTTTSHSDKSTSLNCSVLVTTGTSSPISKKGHPYMPCASFFIMSGGIRCQRTANYWYNGWQYKIKSMGALKWHMFILAARDDVKKWVDLLVHCVTAPSLLFSRTKDLDPLECFLTKFCSTHSQPLSEWIPTTCDLFIFKLFLMPCVIRSLCSQRTWKYDLSELLHYVIKWTLFIKAPRAVGNGTWTSSIARLVIRFAYLRTHTNTG